MAIGELHYLPGGSICVAGPGLVMITDLAAADPVVTACWDAIAAGQDADAVIEIVRRELPAGSARVALGAPDGRSVRVLLSGLGAHAIVARAGGPPEQRDAPESSWLDERYPGAVGVRLAVLPAEVCAVEVSAAEVDGPLPIRTGVALASVAILGVVDLPAGAVDDAGSVDGIGPVDRTGPADEHASGVQDASGWLVPEAFGMTSDDDAGQAVEELVPTIEPSGVAPTVLAVSCPDGHLGPPYDDTCRVCGAPILAQGPFSAPRPALGTLEISSGARIRLDRDIVVGRAPSGGAAAPEERVRLVRVPSPNNDISRNHLRISLEGWHVLVTDLGSTNGTVVTAPGAEQVRLRPHDAMTIVAGSVIGLAGEIDIRVDPRG